MARARTVPKRAELRFLNRELSWLDFNRRVLEQAADSGLPLLERVKFCSFVSSNLDEFFMVRVAGLLDQLAANVAVRSPDGMTPFETLAEIRTRALDQVAAQARLWKRDLRPALAEQGIQVGEVEDCEPDELAELERYFERQVYPMLTPLAVGPGQPFPYISGLSLSLGVVVRHPATGDERFARVKVPESVPRFVQLGERGLFLPLERVIHHFLPWLFQGMEIEESSVFRVTRDADFAVSDEADDLLEAVEEELRRRRFGDLVRLEVLGSISGSLLERLTAGLMVEDDQVYRVDGLLDLSELLELVVLDRPELKAEPWTATVPARFSNGGLFESLGRGDVLVHHPYDSFAATFEAFLRTAAADPLVVALKTTVYRTSRDSPNVPALIEAAEEGKQTVGLVELKARFDERRNIEWSRALEQAGVHVVYGFSDLKIHAKTTLVVRREGDELRRYVHIGTGNYNAATARAYEDFGLFTADPDIAADVADLFNYLTGYATPLPFRKLLVSPFALRARLVELIRSCKKAARAGTSARIRIKVNHLADEGIVRELYAAADNGVTVEIFARTTCTLLPRLVDGEEDIRVRSILGQFFEHSRFLIFEAGDDATYLLGSADLMARNLDHRVEIVTPVVDTRAQQALAKTFDAIMADTSFTWELRADGDWHRVMAGKGGRAQSLQATLMRRARERARRTAAAQSSD
jgi:polyphosphate kinase